MHTSAANGTNVDYICTQLAESKYCLESNSCYNTCTYFVGMMEKKSEEPKPVPGQQPGAAVPGRRPNRGLRVDTVQEFNPAAAGG